MRVLARSARDGMEGKDGIAPASAPCGKLSVVAAAEALRKVRRSIVQHPRVGEICVLHAHEDHISNVVFDAKGSIKMIDWTYIEINNLLSVGIRTLHKAGNGIVAIDAGPVIGRRTGTIKCARSPYISEHTLFHRAIAFVRVPTKPSLTRNGEKESKNYLLDTKPIVNIVFIASKRTYAGAF